VKDGQNGTVRAAAALVADNSEVVVEAAIAGAGITFVPDWFVGPALHAGELT
jgi:DNA-binding transcriptional LysR family regulator